MLSIALMKHHDLKSHVWKNGFVFHFHITVHHWMKSRQELYLTEQEPGGRDRCRGHRWVQLIRLLLMTCSDCFLLSLLLLLLFIGPSTTSPKVAPPTKSCGTTHKELWMDQMEAFSQLKLLPFQWLLSCVYQTQLTIVNLTHIYITFKSQTFPFSFTPKFSLWQLLTEVTVPPVPTAIQPQRNKQRATLIINWLAY